MTSTIPDARRASSAPLAIDRIDHFVLTVADVARASEWYRRVLGMEVVQFAAGRVALRFGSQKINLHPAGAEHAPHARHPARGSADFCLITNTPLVAVIERLEREGIAIELGPVEKVGALGPVDSVYFRDLDENLVEVSTYAPPTSDQASPTPRPTSRRAVGRRRIYQVDAFTKERFTGNPAGVVLDSAGLTDQDMQRIAFELGNPETAFLFPPDGPDHDVHIRYFTPTVEVPLCGHATIAAHYARAVALELSPGTIIQRGLAGDLPVEIGHDDGDYHVTLTLAPPTFGPPLSKADVGTLVAALGTSDAFLLQAAPIREVAAGHGKIMVGLTSRDELFRLTPDMTALSQLSRAIGCNGYHVFTLDTRDPLTLTTARMFAPAIGIPEDPVTGNGNGPLGAYLVRHALVPHDGSRLAFRAAQGAPLGRPGHVHVTVDIEGGDPVRVKIGRDAVIVFEALLC